MRFKKRMFHKLRLCKADILVHSGLVTWGEDGDKAVEYILGDVHRCDCQEETRYTVRHWPEEKKAQWRREHGKKKDDRRAA